MALVVFKTHSGKANRHDTICQGEYCFRFGRARTGRYQKEYRCCDDLCSARILFNSVDDFEQIGDHSTCRFNHCREYRSRLRLEKAYSLLLNNIVDSPQTLVTKMSGLIDMTPTEKCSVKAFITRKRKEIIGTVDNDFINAPVPSHLRVTMTPVSVDHPDNTFLLYDSFEVNACVSPRIVVFSSADMRFKASLATEIFADGTYRIVPKGFATLYTIHTVIDAVPYPIFFCLMENEREQTFLRLFGAIKQHLPKLNFNGIAHVDCQRSSINALKATFHCQIKVCLFHVNQALWRAVVRFGLAAPYNSTKFPRLHAWLRRLMSFPFLRRENMHRCFRDCFERMGTDDRFGVEVEFAESFKNILSYYKRVWLNGVGPEMLSQFHVSNRTNNHSEAFHRWIGSSIQTAHPKTAVLIKLLSCIENESKEQFVQQRLGTLKRRPEKRLDELENSLVNAMNNYASGRFQSDIEYLSVVARVYVEYNHDIKMMRRRKSVALLEPFKHLKKAVIEAIERQDTIVLDDDVETNEDDDGVSDFICHDYATEIEYNTVTDNDSQLFACVRDGPAELSEERPALKSARRKKTKQPRSEKTKPRKESSPEDGSRKERHKRKRPTLLQRMRKQRERSFRS